MRDQLGLPATFTLDACRHGGMTELEEAELTDGQGRALSAHKSQQAYAGYAKRTLKRALAATRKRHHALANATRTNIQNEPQNDIQNGDSGKNKSASNWLTLDVKFWLTMQSAANQSPQQIPC